MTSSPGRPRSTTPRRRWTLALSVVVAAGVAAGTALTSVAPWDDDAAVETRVAGVSIERSSVEAPAVTEASTVPTTVAPTTAPPATVAPATVPPSTAPTTVAPAPVAALAVSPQASMQAEVLAAISFPWQQVLPGWRIEFMPERKGYRGSTFPKKKLIQIYLRSGLTTADYIHVTAHELGHAVDVTLLDDADHRRWNEARGRAADADWWVASGADDFSSGAGDWAESFAWSQVPSGKFYSRVAGIPTDDQLAVMADIIAN